MDWHCDGLNGAKNPKEPSPKARVGGIGVESSKYWAAFRTVPEGGGTGSKRGKLVESGQEGYCSRIPEEAGAPQR